MIVSLYATLLESPGLHDNRNLHPFLPVLPTPGQVRAVRLRRDRVVVVLEHKIYVYNFADLKLLHQIETMANLQGLCALSPNSAQTVLACPGLHKGEVRVELYHLNRTKFISGEFHTDNRIDVPRERRRKRDIFSMYMNI